MPLARDVDLTSGALRGVTGPLVKVPVNTIAYSSSGAAPSNGNNAYNPDGSTLTVPLSATAGPPNGAWFACRLGGRVIGVRYRADSSVTPFFDVVIDGLAYRVHTTTPRLDNVAASFTDYETIYIVADNLPDKVHTVTVIVPCDQAGGSNRALNLLGFVVERGRGYNDLAPEPRRGLTTQSTLTATLASIPFQTAISTLRFRNTDTVDHTVTITGPDGTTTQKALALTANGGEGSLSFDTPRMVSGWKWKIDATVTTSAVYGWVDNS